MGQKVWHSMSLTSRRAPLMRVALVTALTSWQNISLSTSLLSGLWIPEKDIWDLKIMRNGQESHITCSYVVFAVGGGAQFPISPSYEDRVCCIVLRAELD